MTHNQIDYWKMRNEKLNNEQRNAETKRYNLVQEELKRIDQSLQQDLMAINAKYKQRELDLAAEELYWKKRYQNRQLALEGRRLDISQQQNAINQMAVTETRRSNLAKESISAQNLAETRRSNLVKESISSQNLEVSKGNLELSKALQPYTQARIWSETQVDNARADLVKQQTITESTKPYQNMTQSFNNIISPFMNLVGGVLRAVRH